MHDVPCFILSVMGCRSTKHLNSVSDDVTKVDRAITDDIIITRSGEEQCNGNEEKNRNGKTSNGGGRVFMNKDLKELRRNGNRSNRNNNTPSSQSQLDFFEMLDKKIMEGRDYGDEAKQNISLREIR